MVQRVRCLISITVCLLVWVAPAWGGSLRFDGTDDSITISDSIPSGAFSVEVWVNVTTATGNGQIISNRNQGGFGLDIADQVIFPPTIRLLFNGYTVISVDFDRALLGTWMHVAATWDGETTGMLYLYINGMLVQTKVNDGGPINPTTAPLRIGAAGYDPDAENFHGSIDEVRLWNVALDPTTIAAWFGIPLTSSHPNYASLEGAWDFEEGSGQTAATAVNSPARDAQLGTTPGEDVNDPTWQTDSPLPVQRSTFGGIKARIN